MADVQVLAPGTKAAPLTYQIPGAQEIIIKAMFATFDGSGAAGDFLPCIRIIAPGGKVVGEYVTDAAVAAGSSAEVSFAPFLRNTPSSTPSTASGLPSAVMVKANTQTVAGFTTAQITLSSGTFATTDGSIFTASGSNIVVHADGLYASYLYFQPDDFNTDPAQTDLYSEWITATGGANAPWEQIVPRLFNVLGPAGLQGFSPDGGGLAQNMASIGIAYCSAQPTSVKAFLATLSAATVKLSTCLHVVVQLQPISAADLSGFPTFPF